MTIQQFIEKAIEGGWDVSRADVRIRGDIHDASYERALLDPEAWKAVGKVEGWKPFSDMEDAIMFQRGVVLPLDRWLWNMHRMLDALAEGKTIEQYLETL